MNKKATYLKLCFFSFIGSCFGANFSVTNNSDSGVGSLRQAIIDLNAGADASNTITFSQNSLSIALQSDLPLIQNPVSIIGNNAVINGQDLHRSLAFQSSTSGVNSVSSVTIRNCVGRGGNGGDGINSGCSFGSGAGGGAGGFGGGVISLDSNLILLLFNGHLKHIQNKQVILEILDGKGTKAIRQAV